MGGIGSGGKGGRKAKDGATDLIGCNVRLTAGQRDKLKRLGGSVWMREQIERDGKMKWIAVADRQPAPDEWVLTFKPYKDGGGHIESNMLFYGDGVVAPNGRIYRESGLLYWASSDDYNEITHWAVMPSPPD